MWTYLTLLPFLAAVFAVSLTGALFRPGPWYRDLRKPTWTPPGWLFGPVWSVLYVMIAVAGWLVWQEVGFGPILAIWIIQLLFNASWSLVMFGMKKVGWALVTLCLLWVGVAAFIIAAWPVSPTASLLFVPYLMWGTFAGALNLTIWRMNLNAPVAA
jgi:translocator protein